MSNCYCLITAEKSVPCSQEECDRLNALLSVPGEDDSHGFNMEYDGELYLYTRESGCEDELPKKFLEELGGLIEAAGMPWLQFGAAQYDDKPRPDSTGGYSFRITRDGRIWYPVITWET